MSPFDLRMSPFYVLGVSPRDDQAVIADAAETVISDGTLSEVEALRAQQALMAPRPRLAAELAWLPGVAPNRARRLIDAVVLAIEDATGLPPLAGANIASHRCAQKLLPAHPDLLLSFYGGSDEEEILRLLNPERRTSGFPEVPQELMHEALQELMRAHTAALIVFITNQPVPGHSLLEVLQKYFVDGSNIVSFLDELVDRFDEWAADSLRNSEDAISDTLDRIREDPASLEQHLPAFSTAIDKWASGAAPRQYIMGRRHLKDPRTDQLLSKIRGVCLHLNNDLSDPKTSLAVTKAALPAFAGSLEHVELARADIKTLEELVSSHGAFKVVELLITLVTELNEKHRELGTSIKKGNFRSGGTGIAGDLYRLFEKAKQELADDSARAVPFRIILSLAIDLNNQSQATEEALTLLRALQAVPDVPADVADSLNENARVAHQTLLQKQLSTAVKGQRVGRSAALAKELEESSTDAEDRAGWRKLRQQLEHRRNVQRAKWIGWPVVVGGIILIASLSDNKSTSPSYRSSTPTYAAPAGRPADVFTASEIQWCVFELDRLKRIRAITGETAPDAVADAWNARHTDWNSRCSTKKYYQPDYDAAERLLQASSASQQADALSLYKSWMTPAPRLVPGMNR
jgi:Rod binding domain-containing protein